MAGEQAVRELLHLDDNQRVVELGVFPPPPDEIPTEESMAGTAEEHGTGMSGDMYALLGLTDHWSVANRIDPALPEGRALRYDIDSRILLFEDIPEPSVVVGSVYHRAGDRRWIMDTRNDEPAAIVMERPNHEQLVIWGAMGEVRMFVLQEARA